MRRIAAAGLSAAAVGGTYAGLRRRPPGGRERWERTNHAGAPVTLLAGPAVVAGVAVGTLGTDTLPLPRRMALASLLGGVGAVGAYDDLHGSNVTKGLRGHLRALAAGDITSGSVKIAAVSAAGLGCAALVSRDRSMLLLDGALVAGTANLVNLLDLRPGRALKAVLVPCAAAFGSSGGWLAAPVLGAAGGALPADLAGHAMLGDCGANTLGAALGCTLVAAAPARARGAALAAVIGLTLASERVSFTAVIERSALLSRIDAWGRPGVRGSRPPATT